MDTGSGLLNPLVVVKPLYFFKTISLIFYFKPNLVTRDPNSIRLAGTLLAVLSYTLREMPENADLVEKIVFDEKMDLLVFLRHPNNLMKYRTCMLLRLLGRFSCYALQRKWNPEMREALGDLVADSDELTRKVSGFLHFIHI